MPMTETPKPKKPITVVPGMNMNSTRMSANPMTTSDMTVNQSNLLFHEMLLGNHFFVVK